MRQEDRKGISTTRLDAFSDGVFAIAITLLVLEIALGEGDTPLARFLSAWPSYLAYLVSFMTIGAAWISHTALTDELTQTDAGFLRLNLVFLLFVGFLPFPTTLVTEAFGDAEEERVAATVYGLVLLMIKVFGVVLDRYATWAGLVEQGRTDEELQSARRKSAYGMVAYAVAIVIGLFFPGAALAFYFGIALYLVIPFREAAALRAGRRTGPAQSS